MRRLILLSFFRAEADRRRESEQARSIIYAIEEPETSQHPQNQRMLLDALSSLASQQGCQIVLTTHVPGLAGFLPLDSLRYVLEDEHGLTRVRKGDGDESIYETISSELGVIPDNRVRVLLCVEGPHDVEFLRRISQVLHQADATLPDLASDSRTVLLPLGGENLMQWVHNRYLKPLGRPEIHIYDRGDSKPPKYEAQLKEVNARTDGSCAFMTAKRELENYLHPEAIEEAMAVSIAVSDTSDVPLDVARAVHMQAPDGQPWTEVPTDAQKKKERGAKRRLNTDAAARMTPDRIREANPEREIQGWLRKVAKLMDA